MALGAYSPAEADALRRTMGHDRKRSLLLEQLARFAERMIARGIPAEVAERVAGDLHGFANYGFPESHAWSFALIAYATAWLKRHHPAAFYAGLLNSWPMGFYAPSTLVHDARRRGVEVRPPSVQDGDGDCTVEETGDPANPALRIGWRHVRGLTDRAIAALRAARPFGGIADAVRRGGLTRGEALALARADAFAAWEPDRRRAAWEALRAAGDDLPLAPAAPGSHTPRPLGQDERIVLDYAAIGMSLAGHPIARARERLRAMGALDSRELLRLSGRERVRVGGLVLIRQRPETANGTIFLLLEDEHGFINVVVPRTLVAANAEVIRYAPFVVVDGRFEREGAVLNVVGERFEALELGPLTHTSRDFR
jgi:error-prone DNA polymerase